MGSAGAAGVVGLAVAVGGLVITSLGPSAGGGGGASVEAPAKQLLDRVPEPLPVTQKAKQAASQVSTKRNLLACISWPAKLICTCLCYAAVRSAAAVPHCKADSAKSKSYEFHIGIAGSCALQHINAPLTDLMSEPMVHIWLPTSVVYLGCMKQHVVGMTSDWAVPTQRQKHTCSYAQTLRHLPCFPRT